MRQFLWSKGIALLHTSWQDAAAASNEISCTILPGGSRVVIGNTASVQHIMLPPNATISSWFDNWPDYILAVVGSRRLMNSRYKTQIMELVFRQQLQIILPVWLWASCFLFCVSCVAVFLPEFFFSLLFGEP